MVLIYYLGFIMRIIKDIYSEAENPHWSTWALVVFCILAPIVIIAIYLLCSQS